ncbi:MAG: M48 family peptidase [Acidobacteriota bacterium]|nr:M48 family peptidase [Acidobacteriota bacterium]
MKEIIRQIRIFYEDAFRRLKPNAEPPAIDVSFYPYIGINHTIRIRDGRVFVRIAEMFENAPLPVQKSLASILVSKILRRRVPRADLENYQAFVRTETVQTQAFENRRRRGRKIVTTAQGEAYDLAEIFDRLNRIYFQNQLPKPVLTWSAQKTFHRLGHHDSAHETLVVSKSLDDKKVPAFVVEYVVYHEMLHIKHPTVHRNGRRYNHTPAFRRDEEKFEHFDRAEAWIEQNARALKRKVKTQRRQNRRA